MPREYYQPIDPSTPLRDLLKQSMLVTAPEREDGVLLTVEEDPNQAEYIFKVTYVRTTPHARSTWFFAEPSETIGVRARDLMQRDDMEVIAIPPIQWGRFRGLTTWRIPAATGIAAVVGFLLFFLAGPFGQAISIPVALAIIVTGWVWGQFRSTISILAPGDLHLDPFNIVEYVEQRRLGKRPEMRSREDRLEAIHARVEEIKADYGRLGTDIIYRIDNSALFDVRDPVTERFHMAMIAWDTRTTEDLTELDHLASDLEIAYSVAQDHAETLGLAHLPEQARPPARRASAAARLAVRATTDGEREASMRQVARLLDSIALYYLPTVDGETLALEPPSQE